MVFESDLTVRPERFVLGLAKSMMCRRWTLVAKNPEGTYSFDITTTGMVSGSLDPWHDYPSYDYEDMIGGMASFEVIVSP